MLFLKTKDNKKRTIDFQKKRSSYYFADKMWKSNQFQKIDLQKKDFLSEGVTTAGIVNGATS